MVENTVQWKKISGKVEILLKIVEMAGKFEQMLKNSLKSGICSTNPLKSRKWREDLLQLTKCRGILSTLIKWREN